MENKKQKALEEKALDIMKKTTVPEGEEVGIDTDLLQRLSEADASELDRIEQELGIGGVEKEEMQETEDLPVSDGKGGEVDSEPAVLIDDDVRPSKETNKVDGKFEIHVSGDRMSVTLDLVPSKGSGAPITFQSVREKLFSLKVVYGVNYDLLKQVVETAEMRKEEKKGVQIAQGALPEEGKDGSIEYHFKESADILRKDEREGDRDV